MKLGLELSPRIELAQRQEIRCVIRLSHTLEDPVAHAARLYESSKKVNVPIIVGRETVIVRAALVRGEELGRIFDGEAFGGSIGRDGQGEPMIFINRDARSPPEFSSRLPGLIAFHCLASIKVPGWDDDTGTLSQYQAIALELAYAATVFSPAKYERYLEWRKGIERTDFFGLPGSEEIIGRTRKGFGGYSRSMHRNARSLDLAVVTHGETFRLEGGHAVSRSGESIEIHRKMRR